MDGADTRSPLEVLEDHLRLVDEGKLDEDLKRNYAEECVALTGRGIFRGLDGMRKLAEMLADELPCASYRYITKQVEGRVAFLEWKADCPTAAVDDGADSFLIENGRIVVQTIHYTVRPTCPPPPPFVPTSRH